MHYLRSLVVVAFVVAGLAVSGGHAQIPDHASAKFRPQKQSPGSGRYIVLLHTGTHEDNVPVIAHTLIEKHRGKAIHFYKKALKGFAARLSEAEARALSADPRVALVEEDAVISATAIQSSPDWGLDRIDQRQLPLNSAYAYETGGQGVHIYIIDSGVRTSHSEFAPAGRADHVYSAYQAPDGSEDCYGHGTSVASLAAGRTAGVAKDAFIHSVRVLGCDGTGYWSDAINGIDWITANHKKPAVANMSIGGAPSQGLQLAVQGALEAGVTFVAAAGNDAGDACNYAAASIGNALVVGNTDRDDRREYTSNYGACLDLWAPGTSIRAAQHTSDTDFRYASGTSLSSPFVAGAAALYLQRTPAASAYEVMDAVVNTATSGVLSGVGAASPNLALYAPALGDRTPPAVALTAPAAGAAVSGTVDITATASDNLQVSSVEFYYGDTLIASDWTAPYATRWVTDTLAGGSYTLTAVAVDIAGNVTTSASRSVTVAGGGTLTRDAFAAIEAESYDAMQGITRSASYIGYVDGGDWVKFSSVDFGDGAGAVGVRIAVAPDYAGKQVQFRLGSTTGTLIGTLTVSSTGGWSSFATQTAAISGASGVRDLYVVFAGGAGVGNVDAIQFSSGAAPPPTSGELSTSGWTASASASYSPPSRAIDRNSAYKWQNGRSQASSNDYIQVDLGAARTVTRIVLDHAGHVYDYPVAYKLQVSLDGTTWNVVRTGNGTPTATTIDLPSAVTTRFVRVTETGSSGTKWFTVNELRVYSGGTGTTSSTGELDASTWTAAASAFYSPPSRAIDRNAAYKWQNGRSQATSNDSIEIDLGRALAFNRIVLDHSGNSYDYPASYRVDVSDDGSTWTTVQTGAGTAAATEIRLPARYTKRYVRVTETGTTGSNWFSVNEFRIFND